VVSVVCVVCMGCVLCVSGVCGVRVVCECMCVYVCDGEGGVCVCVVCL